MGQTLSQQLGELCNTGRQQKTKSDFQMMEGHWMKRRALPISGAGKDFMKDSIATCVADNVLVVFQSIRGAIHHRGSSSGPWSEDDMVLHAKE